MWVSVHDDVIKWKHFPRYWPFVRGIHQSPVNSPHKGQWRGALMFSLICAGINGWVNNREAGYLRRGRAHYDVTLMKVPLVWVRDMAFTCWTYRENRRYLSSAVVSPSGPYGMRLNEGSGQSGRMGKCFYKISAHYAKERGPIAGWVWLTKFCYCSAAAGEHENRFYDLLRTWVGAGPLTAHTHFKI